MNSTYNLCGYPAGTLIMVSDQNHGRWLNIETITSEHRPIILSGNISPDKAGYGIIIKEVFFYVSNRLIKITCGKRSLLCIPSQQFSVKNQEGHNEIRSAESLCERAFTAHTVCPIFREGKVGYNLNSNIIKAEPIEQATKVFGFLLEQSCAYMADGIIVLSPPPSEQ